MERLLAVIAPSFFAAGGSAAGFYRGLDEGNSDLSTQRVSADNFTGVQPSIENSVGRYQGWANGNPDLFKGARTHQRRAAIPRPMLRSTHARATPARKTRARRH